MKERKHQNLSSGAFFSPYGETKEAILQDITRHYKKVQDSHF